MEEGGEEIEALVFDGGVEGGIGEEADLHVFGFGVLDHAGAALDGADPCLLGVSSSRGTLTEIDVAWLVQGSYHAGDDRVLGKLLPEWFLIADAVLNDHDCGATRVHDGFELGCNLVLVDGLVRADDVVHWRCFCGRSNHWD